MVFTDYTKQRILLYHNEGSTPPSISRKLMEEGIVASRVGITKFLKCYRETITIARQILARSEVATKTLLRVNGLTIYDIRSTLVTDFLLRVISSRSTVASLSV